MKFLGACNLALATSLACLSCGLSKAPRVIENSVENHQSALLPGELVQVVRVENRPTLQLIRRGGDPRGAVAVAVFPPGGSRATLLMMALLEHRLRTNSREPLHSEVHSIGLVISREVKSAADGRSFIEEVHQALAEPVKAAEIGEIHEDAYLQAAAVRVDKPSPFGLCMAQLGAEGPDELSETILHSDLERRLERLETIRRESVGAGRVGLSALGSPELLQAVTDAHAQDWPQGAAPEDSWSPEDSVAVVGSAGGRELRIALRLSDSEAALAGARALRDPQHPLHARLHALSPALSTADVAVTLRPAGACAGVTLSIKSDSHLPSPERLAEAAILVGDEMEATFRRVLTEEETNLALLEPDGAQEAAALAAWTAVRSAKTGANSKRIAEYRTPPGESLSSAKLTTEMDLVRKIWAKREIPSETRQEFGQGELWMMVASPCGTQPEGPDESGLRALAVSSLAQAFSGKRGVTLLPWVSQNGIGLVGHAAPLRGESPDRHAARVARAIALAFAGPPLDGRAVANARSEQLDRIGSDPGVALMVDVLSAGRPSMIQPWGHDRSVAALSTADVERTRSDLVKEPLRASLLLNSTASQAGAANDALSQWLASTRDHTEKCPALKPKPAPAGTWTLQTIEEEVHVGAYVGVWAPTQPVLGHATAYLLNRPAGWLDRALLKPGLVASATASYWGGKEYGALVLQVGAAPHQLEAAVMQARGVLDAISDGALSEQDLALASDEYARRQQEVLRTPPGRLVQLWLGEASPGPTLESMRQFHSQLKASEHRVITVNQRK